MESAEGEGKKHVRNTASFARAGTNATHAPSQFGLMTGNMRSTAAGVFDTATGQWAFRQDNARRGANTPNINVNKAFSGVPDPHVPVPNEVLTAGQNAGWTGGFASAAIGGSIRALFGGVGAVPGAIIGSVIGSVGGAIGGGMAGSHIAENLVEELLSDDEVEEEDENDFKKIK